MLLYICRIFIYCSNTSTTMNQIRIFFFSFLILFFAGTKLIAQDIPVHIRILNQKDQPVAYATISVVKNNDSTQQINHTADSTGSASFLLKKKPFLIGAAVRQELWGICLHYFPIQKSMVLTIMRKLLNGAGNIFREFNSLWILFNPPLNYIENYFDAVYALSVFTHLSELNHHTWIRELHRIIKSGGYLLITTQGEAFSKKLSEKEKAGFSNGALVIRDKVKEGHRSFSAFHPEIFMQSFFSSEWKIVQFIKGKIEDWGPEQDTWIVQKLQW